MGKEWLWMTLRVCQYCVFNGKILPWSLWKYIHQYQMVEYGSIYTKSGQEVARTTSKIWVWDQQTVAVLGTARPWAKQICRAPTPGKNLVLILFVLFSLKGACTTQFFLSLSITLFQIANIFHYEGENFFCYERCRAPIF